MRLIAFARYRWKILEPRRSKSRARRNREAASFTSHLHGKECLSVALEQHGLQRVANGTEMWFSTFVSNRLQNYARTVELLWKSLSQVRNKNVKRNIIPYGTTIVCKVVFSHKGRVCINERSIDLHWGDEHDRAALRKRLSHERSWWQYLVVLLQLFLSHINFVPFLQLQLYHG